MKKYIYVLLMALTTTAYAQNLLDNPGFETWSSGMPDYWLKDDSIAIFQENGIVHGGTVSAKDSLFTQTQDIADFIQRIPVQPNTQYMYSIWVYDNDDAGRVRQGIYWVPTGSNWSGDYSDDSTDWQLFEWTVTSPASAESADVLIRAYDVSANWDGDAVFYLDDAYFALMVGVYESKISSHAMPIIRNPVISGINFAAVINNLDFYPIEIYNVMGRQVKIVTDPNTQLNLPSGICFLKMHNIEKNCAKLIVVR